MALRRRLTLLAAGTVWVTVVFASVLCYLAMRVELRGEIDETLRQQAELVTEESARLGGPLPAREIPTSSEPGEAAGLVQLLRPDGRLRNSDASEVRVPATAADRAVAAGRLEETLGDREIRDRDVRVLTVPLANGAGAVQLTRSLESTNETLARLRVVLALLCLFGTAFALVVSRIFSRQVIAPLTEMTEAAEHIETTADLTRRIDHPGDDEVGRMAARFNAMLDRLQGSRAELAESVAAQRQLVADASHELRTPITSLRTNIEMLRMPGGLSAADRRTTLTDSQEQAEELSALVNDLIELARGDQPLSDHEEVRLEEIVADAVDRTRRHTPGVRFETALQEVTVAGSSERLARAVTNLLDNAAKHSPPGRTVEVVLRDGELTVRDHGDGVPDQDKPHVFDRFYRGLTSRGRSGSGLGLAIVRQAVEAHGGRVAVEDAPGGGALFRLTLPTQPARDDRSEELLASSTDALPI